jgi:nicotinate phosphoribosyltransferase
MAILHQFPAVDVEYEFKCRNDLIYSVAVKDRIEKEIEHLCSLRFTNDELSYLRSIPFFKENYIEFLKGFQLQREYVHLGENAGAFTLSIKGNWFHTVLFEVPLLAIISEVCLCPEGRNTKAELVGLRLLHEKVQKVREYRTDFQFADFGLRRRFSSFWQDQVVSILAENLPTQFIGSSNVFLAKKYNLRPIGTMSHQWIMCGQGLPNVRLSESQRFMLDAWVREYRGDLGIALSDTLGFDAFLRDFDLFFAKLYDGCRHDSGDPVAWGEKLIAHYKALKIDPSTKTAVFSDGLTFPLALSLHSLFYGRIKTSFGIGTNLTNDTGVIPLQNVIKLVKVNGNPVAKISDSRGKGMCQDAAYLRYLKSVFKIEDNNE